MNKILAALVALFFATGAYAATASQGQVLPAQPEFTGRLATQTGMVDTSLARAVPGQGDNSADVAALQDTASCTHSGKYFYKLTPYGQLSLGEVTNCRLGANMVTSSSELPLCQMDGNLRCDNRRSGMVMNKVAYGRNYYYVNQAGIVVNDMQFAWADPGLAAQVLPGMQAQAAKQVAALAKLYAPQTGR